MEYLEVSFDIVSLAYWTIAGAFFTYACLRLVSTLIGNDW